MTVTQEPKKERGQTTDFGYRRRNSVKYCQKSCHDALLFLKF